MKLTDPKGEVFEVIPPFRVAYATSSLEGYNTVIFKDGEPQRFARETVEEIADAKYDEGRGKR
ncbi:unnamed protein product [marine sediment metagenome]|uniref:Uncharacterized protein n=1 Tax=marine sediment metagenome TaxID=412755 RepID=X0TX39_9ZZZZ